MCKLRKTRIKTESTYKIANRAKRNSEPAISFIAIKNKA